MTITNDTLTAVAGIRVGHWTDTDAATGCTVIVCPTGTVGGVDQRGGAPGTRETDLLRPMHLVQHVNAIVLAGGSAFGLATADGVMRQLRDCGIGFPVLADVVVPIVPAAILFDLNIGRPDVWPTADAGYTAASVADDAPVPLGSIGAGTGCKVGAMFGVELATKAGIGSATVRLAGGVLVSALIAVNALGDVLTADGQILAGLRDANQPAKYAGTFETLRHLTGVMPFPGGNTIIGVVATNAKLTKEEANLVAQMAQDGVARAVRPAHTLHDGDTLFTLATGEVEADANLVGIFAAEAVAEAIRSGVREATGLAGIPALRDLQNDVN